MSAVYTSGPWFRSEYRPDPIRQPIMAKTPGGACGVADVYLPPYPQRGEGNADLIAAAPDLYEALEAFMALDPNFRNTPMRQLESIINRRDESERMARTVLHARRALAKARGETEQAPEVRREA